jgi:hypothetical protein
VKIFQCFVNRGGLESAVRQSLTKLVSGVVAAAEQTDGRGARRARGLRRLASLTCRTSECPACQWVPRHCPA